MSMRDIWKIAGLFSLKIQLTFHLKPIISDNLYICLSSNIINEQRSRSS